MPDHWLSTERMTVAVTTDDQGRITEAAPIVRKFVGQPLDNLIRWMEKQGGFRQKVLGAPQEPGD